MPSVGLFKFLRFYLLGNTTEQQACTIFLLDGHIRWAISDDDAVTLPIGPDGNVHLIHPSVHASQEIRTDSTHSQVITSRIAFVGEDILPEFVESILRRLRYVARQPELADEVIGVLEAVVQLPPKVGVNGEVIRARRANPYYYNSALAWSDVAKALALPDDHVTPIYEELLFQAIVASRYGDYRKATLYAAIAIESVAQHFCGTHYEAALNRSGEDADLRIVNFATHEGTHRKDPVFEKLCNGAGLSSWIHEIPLYILKRSLLIDEPSLFRDAVALSKTRNSLAHSGPPTKKQTPPILDVESTARAIELATRVLAWFGVERAFVRSDPGERWIPIGEQ